MRQLDGLLPLVEKTAGPQEKEAFNYLLSQVRGSLIASSGSATTEGKA